MSLLYTVEIYCPFPWGWARVCLTLSKNSAWICNEQTSLTQDPLDARNIVVGDQPESTDDGATIVVQVTFVKQVADDLGRDDLACLPRQAAGYLTDGQVSHLGPPMG